MVSRSALPASSDPDHDGLTTRVEKRRTKTKPHKFDSDGDGFGDGAEVRAGTNPRDPDSHPLGPASRGAVPQASADTAAGTAAPGGSLGAMPPSPPAAGGGPETTITAGPAGTTAATSASFSFASSAGGSSFQCRLDSGAWTACTPPRSYSGLATGSHRFEVKATDTAGRTDASPAARTWRINQVVVPVNCTTHLAPGANLASAVASAAGGAVICLDGGSYRRLSLDGVHKAPPVTIQSGTSQATVDGISLTDPSGLRFVNLAMTSGVGVTPSAANIAFVDNDITGENGIYMFGDYRIGERIEDVLIEGNLIHDIDYTGTQGTGEGYGIEGVGDVRGMTIRENTIQSPASDYIQSATPVDWVVDRNTFLGPSLLADHEDHQDLWQIFGGGEDITFTNNVARDTETQESLLFQEGAFSDVVIENNLFDHDSRGYTCQIYQSSGLTFRNNTIVGSHWGCLFRDYADNSPGSGYLVDHNVFADTEASVDVSTEGRADDWGTYDYNVSSDGSASGVHSVRNWNPSWTDTITFVPAGLALAAGYRP
ncbi:MAG: right-handed parallel beta-helix repeat-containing protein [Solirubrobacterales bacterium]